MVTTPCLTEMLLLNNIYIVIASIALMAFCIYAQRKDKK